jgi:hypothetical protein
MIDLVALKRIAEEGEPADSVVIERNWLRRALVEIAEGRIALATLALGGETPVKRATA